MEKHSIGKRFSKASESYDEVAHIQREMANTLLDFLSPLKTPRNISELGCGTGYLSEKLIQMPICESLCCLDLSHQMIEVTKARLENRPSANIRFVQTDAESYDTPPECDLIVSNATVQWFHDFPAFLQKTRDNLPHEGLLVFSHFGQKNLWEVYQSYEQATGRPLTKLVQYVSAQSLQDQLRQSGFRILKFTQEQKVEHFANLKDLLSSLKRMGVSFKPQSGSSLKKNEYKKWLEIFNQSYQQEAGAPLTWDYFCVVAIKEFSE